MNASMVKSGRRSEEEEKKRGGRERKKKESWPTYVFFIGVLLHLAVISREMPSIADLEKWRRPTQRIVEDPRR